MTRVVIIEDEDFAVHRLRMLLEEVDEEIEVVAVLDGIKQAVKWLSLKSADIIFLDINLSDGNAFKIFEQIEIKIPIIFTTAYHEYAIRAFEQYSIGYLLKPVSREKLQKCLSKLKLLKSGNEDSTNIVLNDFLTEMKALSDQKRFMVQLGNKIRVIELPEITHFSLETKTIILNTKDGRKYAIDGSLKQLECNLAEQQFFRVNRQYLVARSSILELLTYSPTQVKLVLKNSNTDDIFVAREKLRAFKKWLVDG